MKTIIHIGFPKTGTTTQQNYLFCKHSQLNYLGKPYKDRLLKHEILNLITQESLTYSNIRLKNLLEKYQKNSSFEDNKLMISDEIIVSAYKARDKGLVAQRLKTVFSSCKIIVTIRNQLDILNSIYINSGRILRNLHKKKTASFLEFENWLENIYPDRDRNYIGNVNYYNIIKYYSNLFGKENICILLYEDYKKNQTKFIQKLTSFIQIDFNEAVKLISNKHENKRISQAILEYERFKQRFFPISSIPVIYNIFKPYLYYRKLITRNKTAKVFMPEHWKKRLREYYAENNRKLAEEFDLPLESYDYPF